MPPRESKSPSFNKATLVSEIRAALENLPRLSTEPVRAIRREISRRIAKAPPKEVLELAYLLLKGDPLPPRWFAYELIYRHRMTLASLTIKELERLGEGISSWDQVDTFACYLSGQAWRQRQIRDDDIHRWAHSPDRWWRRTALVSTVPLNRKALGGTADAKRTLQVCRMLLHARDDMVVKALSWALRELSKQDRKAVQDFVARYGKALPALVKREVRCKLETGLKNRRKSH